MRIRRVLLNLHPRVLLRLLRSGYWSFPCSQCRRVRPYWEEHWWGGICLCDRCHADCQSLYEAWEYMQQQGERTEGATREPEATTKV